MINDQVMQGEEARQIIRDYDLVVDDFFKQREAEIKQYSDERIVQLKAGFAERKRLRKKRSTGQSPAPSTDDSGRAHSTTEEGDGAEDSENRSSSQDGPSSGLLGIGGTTRLGLAEALGTPARTPGRRNHLLRSMDMSSHSPLREPRGDDPEEDCSICFESYPRSQGRALSCQHWFCNQCWADSWKSRLADAESAMSAKCLAQNCTLHINKVDAKRMLQAVPEDYERYERFFINAFVEKNPFAVWCPNPTSCDYIALYTDSSALPPANSVVVCACGWRFCFHCKQPAHRPASCEQTRQWAESLQKEGGASVWITQNTKRCPGCQAPIEKNEGCLHMTCKCRHEFCWMCMGPWSSHGSATGGYFRCNVYKPELHDQLGRQPTSSRWLHHFERWEHHDTATNVARTERKSFVQGLVSQFQLQHPGWSGAFLWEAFYLVLECRELLKYTYVASYYLPETYKDLDLYQFLQGQLERHTDSLYQALLNFDVATGEPALKATISAAQHYFHSMTEAIESGVKNLILIESPTEVKKPRAAPPTTSQPTSTSWFSTLFRKR